MSAPLASPSKPEGTFKKLVRSLSRSGAGAGGRAVLERRDSSRERKQGTDLSKSPEPTSYFPPPPSSTIRNDEASGRARHPEEVGARAADVGAPIQGAPGVSFAPAPPGATRTRPNSELDGWNPPPRRTQSQRVKRTTSKNDGENAATAGGRSRAGSEATGAVPPVPAGERKGVQLEDKPLSRGGTRGSMRKAMNGVKRSFVPIAKVEGEKRVLILVADGTEEIELLTPYDVFVRASLNPVIASVSPLFSPSQSLAHITLSRGAKILADTQFETLKQEYKDDFDALIIPGGAKGAERLSQDKSVQQLIWSFYESGKLVGMICAGSLAAKAAGIALGERITSHPSVKGDLEKHYEYSEDRVCVSSNLVTSRGPGTALEWSLQIVEILAGKAKRDEVAGPMML